MISIQAMQIAKQRVELIESDLENSKYAKVKQTDIPILHNFTRAINKQIPMSAVVNNPGDKVGQCPCCNTMIISAENYCANCGQRIIFDK